MKCDKCGVELAIGDFPFCPHGRGTNGRSHDDIPGGVLIENLGPEPIRVYSHSERLRIAKERGLIEAVRHVPVPGSDKSPHTTNWATMDAQTLDNGRVLVSRPGALRGNDDSDSMDSVVQNRFNLTGTAADARSVINAIKGGR